MLKFSKWVTGMLVLALVFALFGCGQPKSAQTGAKATKEDALAFYKGKNLNFIVPYNTGGGYDRYARLIAPFIQKYIPGVTVVVRNVPGGGSLTGTNELYLSKGDGLTIGVLNGVGIVTAQAVGQEGVKYDMKKFNWLGRFYNDPKVFVVKSDSPIKTFDDLKKASPLKVSVNGVGSSEYVGMSVAKKILLPQMDIVSGYNTTAEGDMAMLRGEVQGTSGSIDSKMPLIESNKARPIFSYAKKRSSELPDVPLATELTTGKDQELASDYTALLELGRLIAAPPGVPDERLQVLRDAVVQSMQDPDFLDQAKKAKQGISNITPDEILNLVTQSLQMPDELKKLMAAANAG